MSRRYARSNAEAHVYMDLHPCPACGARDFDRRSSVIDDDGTLCSCYRGSCAGCGAPRELVFEIPATIRKVHPSYVEYGGDEPSRLLDPGEWLAVADAHGKRVSATQRDLDIARAAIEEVKKFLPQDVRGSPDDRVPDAAFWTARGRAIRDRAPDRFAKPALSAELARYRDGHEHALATPPANRPAVTYPPPGAPALADHPVAALVDALAVAIARQHGFAGDDLVRHASHLTGELTSVVRRFEIRAREDKVRLDTTSQVDRLLDGILASGGEAAAELAPHRAMISQALRGLDLARLTESLQALADWLREPSEAHSLQTLIGNLAVTVGEVVTPSPQGKPTASAETKPTAVERSDAKPSLDRVFPGTRKDSN